MKIVILKCEPSKIFQKKLKKVSKCRMTILKVSGGFDVPLKKQKYGFVLPA